MVIERAGIRNEAGYWIKGDGGQKRGFGLLEELKKENVETLPALFQYAANKHGEASCMGTRQLLARERILENDKKLEKLRLGDYSYSTYKEVQDMVTHFGNGLQSINIKSGERVAMFAETRYEWFVSALGFLSQNVSVVTLYTNLPDDGIAVSLKETEVSTVITSYELLPRLIKMLPQCPKVSQVIVIEDQLDGIGSVETDGIKVTTFKEILDKGKDVENPTSNPPKGDDLAIIMYTSGSTSQPKGVMLTHTNILWAIKGYIIQADMTLGDRYLAYLPLAHVMELSTELALIAMNVTIAYSSPMTLTSNSPKIMKGTLGDAKVARPTCLSAVPLILERVIKNVSTIVENQGYLKAKLFNEALKFKQRQGGTSFAGRVLDAIIFNRVKDELGGELRTLVVGGAPLSPDIHNKFRAIFGCTIQVGYGATETSASITSMDSDDPRTNQCGPPNLGVNIKLQDWEEGEYLSTDKPHPRGEIVVGGPMVSQGYYNLPGETAEAFVEEDGMRWFRTGDIGEIDETGVIYIIDRKKDLVKLKNGEYVSLGNIESRLKTHPIIDSLCICARPGAQSVVALVVPVIERLKKIGATFGYAEDADVADLCNGENIKACVLEELKNHGKKQHLGRWDIPLALHMTAEPWTPESGLVTAALKLRRTNLKTHFSEAIDAMYHQLSLSEE